MIIFTATAGASMRNALERLEGAGSSDQRWAQDAAFQEVMQSLVSLAVAMHRGDRPAEDDLTKFRQRVVELMDLTNNRGNLGAYLSTGTSCAGRALQPGAYYQAALIRTAAQLLLDDYPGMTGVFSQYDHEGLTEIEHALREAAVEVPPLPEDAIPEGMPDSHWWWRAPHGDPEMYELLHGTGGEDV